MYVCMYVCIYVYICICIDMKYVSLGNDVYIYTYMYVCLCVHTYLNAGLLNFRYLVVHIYIYI